MRVVQAAAVAMAVTLMACGGSEGPEGPQGEKGEKGDTGAAGLAGATGPSINQTVNYSCLNAGTGAQHQVYKFPDGSIVTNCHIIWSLDGSASGFNIWRTGQPGAADAYCQTLASGGSWAEFSWNGNLASTMTVHGSSIQAYTLTCTKY